ncbi:MAG TPA: alpha-L-fucosidase, partial [Chthonomonadales bacterium]|nr:alpha-L-fucosidase [Chthonomonadales bacterium]
GAAAEVTASGFRCHTSGDYRPRPTPQQLAWQESRLSMFFHFGVNTFTDREWGDGKEDPSLFNPSNLDARQWTETARDAGFKTGILTAKHHDGFCLWPSKYTDHSVKGSDWRNGTGDVVREFERACRETGLKMGLYLSPWDRHEPTYGDSPAYNRHYINQLTELLSEYGEIAEVWFDGANGEGPNGKKQVYDWQGFYETIRKLQPRALIAISGPDIRWVGNEDGFAHETEWCIQNPDPVFHKGITHRVWWPSECDVSIRPGWFWHESQDSQVKTVDELTDIYFRSVGHNSVLLLNVPPNRSGLLSNPDVSTLKAFRATLNGAFAQDAARGCKAVASSSLAHGSAAHVVDGRPDTYWTPAARDAQPWIELNLGETKSFELASLEEHIKNGQSISAYRVEALTPTGWSLVGRGTTIGHTKLHRFPVVSTDRVRLTIESSLFRPEIRTVSLYPPA